MYLEDLMPYLQRAKEYDGYVMGMCPFHQSPSNRASLMVYKKEFVREKGWFRCLSCEAEGTWDYLLSALEGMPIRMAPTSKVEWGLPPLPRDQDDWEALAHASHNKLKAREHLGWYWEIRGVKDRIEPCMLGWYQGWYTIPVFDPDRNFKRLVLRAGKQIETATGLRYHTSPGAPTMYVPDWHRFQTSSSLFIVFGMVDALALSDLGFAVATSTAGKDSFKAEWLKGISPFVYVVPDMGEEVTAQRLANKIGGRAKMIGLRFPEECKDPADYLKYERRNELLKELAPYQ